MCMRISVSQLSTPVQVQEDTVWGEVSGCVSTGGARTGWEGWGRGYTMGWESACARARAGTRDGGSGSGLYRLAFLEGALRLEPFLRASL